MKSNISLQSNFDKPELFFENDNILFFSKKSPFKDTCNEDAVGVFKVDKGFVLAIADGAGGHPKGEEAAELVLKNIETTLKDHSSSESSYRSRIIDAIEKTNKDLLSNGNGARTTVTVCEVVAQVARGYQVGDSTLVQWSFKFPPQGVTTSQWI